MTKTTLLIHTGDGAAWVWPHFYRYWKKNWRSAGVIDTVWLSEVMDPKFDGIQSFHVGNRPWGKQLWVGLSKMDCKYVIYFHEDYFIVEPSDTEKLLGLIDIMDKFNMNLLKICGEWMGFVDHSNLPADPGIRYKDEIIWLYNNRSNYLVSHQASIWNREFLMSTVGMTETPWQHETEGTKRLRERGIPLHAYRGYPPILYRETVNHGKIRDGAEPLFKE